MNDNKIEKVTFDAVSSIDKKLEVLAHSDSQGYPYLYEVSFIDNNGQKQTVNIKFQNGVESETGVNGVTMECVLAIVAHRLKAFQNSKFACGENEHAIMCSNEALDVLNQRTRKRIERGIEGKDVV